MAKKNSNPITAPDVNKGLIEYKMPRKLAESLLRGKKVPNPQQVLCDYVNTNCGLKGYCVRVLVDL